MTQNEQRDPRSNPARPFMAKSFLANNKRRLEWRIKERIVDTERGKKNMMEGAKGDEHTALPFRRIMSPELSPAASRRPLLFAPSAARRPPPITDTERSSELAGGGFRVVCHCSFLKHRVVVQLASASTTP